MLTACIALLLWAVPSQGMSTYCEIPSVEEMQNTSLTCKFSDDMTKLKQNFQVQFYKSDTTDSPDDILNCLWADNKLECQVHKCCEYDSHVTEHLTVRVLNVTKARVGRYACFVVPAAPDSYEFCNFTLREKHQTVTSESSHAALAALVVIPISICILITIFVWRRKRSDITDGLHRPVHTRDKMDNDDSKENNSQHSGNISEPEEESLLSQTVGEAQKQTDLTETDSCERTVKHKLEQGAEEGANTSEGISNTGNIKILDIDVHSDLTQKSLEGNDAHTATQESDISEQSAVPLQKPGDDTTDSKPHAAKRNHPLMTTESGGKSHALMLPQNTEQRKRGVRFWKSAEVINPNIIMNKRYNESVENKDNEEPSNTASSYKTDIKGQIPKEEKHKSSEAYKEETELKTDRAEKTETKREKKERKKSERKVEEEKKNKEKAEQKKNEERKKMEEKAEKEKLKAGKLGKIVNNKEVEDKFQEEQSKWDECKVGVSDRNIIETDSFQQCEAKMGQEPITTPSEMPQDVPKENIHSEQKVIKDCTDISKTAVINQDEHSNADSRTEPRNILQDNNPSHGTNVSSCEIDMGTCTSTNDNEDSSGLTVQSEPRSGEETKTKPKNIPFNLIRLGSKGGKNNNNGKKPTDMATPQEP